MAVRNASICGVYHAVPSMAIFQLAPILKWLDDNQREYVLEFFERAQYASQVPANETIGAKNVFAGVAGQLR